MLTQQRLKEVVEYEPETGTFRWKVRLAHNSRRRVGDIAGGKRATNWYIAIDGVGYTGGKLAFLYMTGAWPKQRIAFRDGDALNLKFDNLELSREVLGNFDHKDRVSRNAYNRAHRQQYPDYYRASDLRRNFGIDLADYQRMFVEQKGVCAICSEPETEKRLGKTRWLAVDHDHETGDVRGLLCQSCNKAVGLLRDNPELARGAAAYLEKHRDTKIGSNVIRLRKGS